MASMRDIKRRKNSIQSTQQITRAMKLVATVKLQKARQRAEETAPYFDLMYSTVVSLLSKTGAIDHPYIRPKEGGKTLVITISSNRGLAGGYNSSIAKLVMNSGLKKENVLIYAIGGKAAETLAARGYTIYKDASDKIESPQYTDAMQVCKEVLSAFSAGEISEIYLAYTNFINTVVHVPTLLKLLPIEVAEEEHEEAFEKSKDFLTLMNFEPNEEEAVTQIIPKYLTSLIYGAFMEALASENCARMQAMDSATSNAEELIDDLTLKYNRARQGSITQELTEIIAGAEAIS